MSNYSNKILNLTNERYNEYYQNTKSYLKFRDISDDNPYYFTPHGPSHSQAVEEIVDKMLIKCKDVNLSELEKFLLLAAIWTHDLGMNSEIAKEYFKDSDENGKDDSVDNRRKKHHKISAWCVLKKSKEIFLGSIAGNAVIESELKGYADVINTIINYHRSSTNVEKCCKETYLGEERVRCRLLACFLRLGDTLNVDSTRFDRKKYEALLFGDFPRESIIHWLKSYLVSNIYLDNKTGLIIVDIHLPENESKDEKEAKENEKNLEELIRRPIDADLVAVRETFREYSLPIYTNTKIVTNYIPGFDSNDRKSILGVISDIALEFSPNSSKVIEKSLEGIKALSQMDTDSYQKFSNQFGQLKQHLQETLNKRPCHVGLRKIIGELEEFEAGYSDPSKTNDPSKGSAEIKSRQSRLLKLVERIENEREEMKNKILTVENTQFLNDVNNIFLFGYSSMVLKFLDTYIKTTDKKDWNKKRIYVFECAGKRRFSINNTLEYNDGIYYASKIRDLGFKEVRLLPDIAFASLLEEDKFDDKNEKEINNSNSVVLFGANGIHTYLATIDITDKDIANIATDEVSKDPSKSEGIKSLINIIYNNVKSELDKSELDKLPDVAYIKNIDPQWKIVDGEKLFKINKEKDQLIICKVGTDKIISAKTDYEEDLNKSQIPAGLKNEFSEQEWELTEGAKVIKNKEWGICYSIDYIFSKGESKISVKENGEENDELNKKFENVEFKHLFSKPQDESSDKSISYKISWHLNLTKYDDIKDLNLKKNGEESLELSIYKMRYIIKKENKDFNIYRSNVGPCGHSSGHLTIARIANYYNIPVMIIAESFKKGKINWNLSAERKGDWLTTQESWLKELTDRVKLVNYREDIIPEDLIAKIISDDLLTEINTKKLISPR